MITGGCGAPAVASKRITYAVEIGSSKAQSRKAGADKFSYRTHSLAVLTLLRYFLDPKISKTVLSLARMVFGAEGKMRSRL